MTQLISIIGPVFAVMGLGFIFARLGLFRPETAKGLSDFTFTLAVPALLFRTVERTAVTLDQSLLVWGSFFGALVIVWGLATVATRLILARPEPDAAAIGMTACFGNVVMLGVPLVTNAYGAAAAVPLSIVLAAHTPVLWVLGSMHMALAETDRRRSLAASLWDVAVDLAKNPIILGVVAGNLWRWTGLGIHPTVDRVLLLLGDASTTTALVAVGIGLVGIKFQGQAPTLGVLVVLKLVAMPVIAWMLSTLVFRLDAVSAGVVVLLAAMPAGANAYLFATRYDRVLNSTSGAIAIGTVASLATLAVVVSAMAPKA